MKQRKFKNKISEYGFYFGKFCYGIGALTFIVSLLFICNDGTGFPVNWCGAFFALLGIIINRYGAYRIGGDENAE